MYITKTKAKNDKNTFGIVMNYVVNSYNRGNKDGFYIKFENNEIRTLDYQKFLDFIIDNQEQINDSKDVNLHLRMATHGKGEDCIHGWNFGDYDCYHNGVVQIKNKKIPNDSYDFFKSVDKGNLKKTIKAIKSELKTRTGTGAFFMIDKSKNNSFIFSKNHTINVHLINDNIISINSNDDVHKFEPEIELESTGKKEIWGLEFDTEESELFDLGLLIEEDLVVSFDNCILIIDQNGVKQVIEMDFPSYKHYNRYWDKYDDEWYSEKKRKSDYKEWYDEGGYPKPSNHQIQDFSGY